MASKEDYIKKLQAQLNQWEAQIETLKADAQRIQDRKAVELEKRITQLQDKCGEAKSKMEHIRQSDNVGWKEMKEGAEQMWSGIKDLLKDTKTEFQKGIEEGKKSS
jgi:predicted  nucleic acid-binding Zn-ribbon protein